MILLAKTSEKPKYSITHDEDFFRKVSQRLELLSETRRLMAYYLENSSPRWLKYAVIVNSEYTIELASYLNGTGYVKLRPLVLRPELYDKRMADEIASAMYTDSEGNPVVVEVLHYKSYYKTMLDRLKKEEEALTKAAARWSGRKA